MLPEITINLTNTIYGSPENGELIYKYSAFQNLKMVSPQGTTGLTNLNLSAKDANINITNPVQLDTESAYDGSVNLIVNDTQNPLKIVNSRFYLIDSNSYEIADRKGNLDTNIYTSSDFKIETGLIKSVRTISSMDYIGLFTGGRMPVGNYTFYFKLADADGNETDFILESGKIICHIGTINQPTSIRGGQLNENSEKAIKFKLKNLDLAYDYINIYYTRSSGDGDIGQIKAYKIEDKFKIVNIDTDVFITGFEDHVEIDSSEINIKYEYFNSAKTNESCQNISFIGNVDKNYEVYSSLEKYSLLITPKLISDKTIGNLSYQFAETFPDGGYEYYNTNNIYYKLGYWDDEIYRIGIVYILPDYTLSPVFNIRGIKELNSGSQFTPFTINAEINYDEYFQIENSQFSENSKGIFKIVSDLNVFNGSEQIKPLGLSFNFPNDLINGDNSTGKVGLKELTKGFMFVRQKRIPTIVSQGIAIGTSDKSFTPIVKGNISTSVLSYFSESFLKPETFGNVSSKPKLGRNLFSINTNNVKINALICPEAHLNQTVFGNLFNSSEYSLKKIKYDSNGIFIDNPGTKRVFGLGNLKNYNSSSGFIKSDLLLIESGIELSKTNSFYFSSRAGNEYVPYKHSDPVYGNIEDISVSGTTDEILSNSTNKLRGNFNSFVGTTVDTLQHGQIYNIYEKNYDFYQNWKNYFKVRANDSSPYFPIGDRNDYNSLTYSNNMYKSLSYYRGDCYINTFAHRILWNFIDPELPTNKRIVDPFTWYKNYRVKTTSIMLGGADGDVIVDSTDGSISGGTISAQYKKILQLYTWKTVNVDDATITTAKLTMPDSKHFKKYSEANGVFGAEKINRPDVNSVDLGHWVVFKICSNSNLAMRDISFSNPSEEAIHKEKRSFYPLTSAKSPSNLPESNVINQGISKVSGDKYYFEVPNVPFIKTNFSNRVHYSDPLLESSFKNGNRVFRSPNYQDYTSEYGSLVKLVEWYGRLIAIMEHGILMIPVNERAMMANENGENIYINTENVLPKNPKILSNTFGSLWESAILKTSRYIYGIDTVAKKIWRTNGETFENISDMKIQKFLNDNINLKESDILNGLTSNFTRIHYNAFKQDVMFVFNYGNIEWNLCWNELQEKWITRYSWVPAFSENINNIFYTFANNEILPNNRNCYLYKHGFAGNEEIKGNILPTVWYNELHPFEFEFIVVGVQGVQKIFDNLKIVSNLASPDSFEFEIVGESYLWNKEKNQILQYGSGVTRTVAENNYETPLSEIGAPKKIPAIWYRSSNDVTWPENASILRDLTIRQHNKTKENLIISYQKGADIKSFGRLKGNMQYVEDSWDIQIQPITFKYAYLKNGNLTLTEKQEMKLRDKYIKIKVKYSGEQQAIITALQTFFTISYS